MRTSIRKSANKHLQKGIVLIDESIQFLIHFGHLIGSKERMGLTLFDLWSLISKLKSLAISFRELILIGQADSSRLILRGLIETNDLIIVAISDQNFCHNYAPDNPDHDDNIFWKTHIAYGQILPRVEKALKIAGFQDEQTNKVVQWKKKL